MDPRRHKFLAYVLGEEGAGLLIKAIDQTPVLEHAIVPRTILAWLQSSSSFEGQVLDGLQMAFEKSESGLTGSIEMGGESYAFEDANVFHAAASVAVALGIEELESEGLRTLDIERIGKTIDLMAKVQFVNSNLEKVSPPGKFKDLPEKLKAKGYPADKAFAIAWSQKNKEEKTEKSPEEDPEDDKLSDEEYERKDDAERLKARKAKKLDKALGDSAPPTAPAAAKPAKPSAPKASTTASPKMAAPKPTSTSTMSLTRSEASSPCLACGGKQFADDKFVGCICFSALSGGVSVDSSDPDVLKVSLGREWDDDSVALLLESFGK